MATRWLPSRSPRAWLTVAAASARFGGGSNVHTAVQQGWTSVGVATDAPTNATGPSDSTPAVAPEAELLLRRTGGVTGAVKERRTSLHELPSKDAKRWNKLLNSEQLQALGGSDPVRDGFCYRVACEALSVDVTVPEQHLSESQRNLFRRTLSAG